MVNETGDKLAKAGSQDSTDSVLEHYHLGFVGL